MTITRKLFLSAFAALLLAALPLQSSAGDDVMSKPDDSWVSVSGTVEAVSDEHFTLDYDHGLITIEFDDYDRWYDEARAFLEGDQVTVYGRVDDDLFELRTIEASSVYVKGIDTFFTASAVDEETPDFLYWHPTSLASMEDGSWVSLTGTVTEANGEEFTLHTGMTTMTVEVDQMAVNPLEGNPDWSVGPGDYVSVTGEIDNDFFEGREIVASSVVTIAD